MSVLEQLKAARRVSVPIVAIQSSDLNATVKGLNDDLNGFGRIQWDCVRGPTAMNEDGSAALGCVDLNSCFDLTGMLAQATNLPPETMLFVHNAHRFLSDVGVMQALLNLRDVFKRDRRMVVLLGCQLTLPVELRGDVVCLDEPLPSGEQIDDIIGQVFSDADIAPTGIDAAHQAVQGLTAFQIDQLTAMNMRRDGLDTAGLWNAKHKQISQTKGLSVYDKPMSFDGLAGLSAVKQHVRDVMHGRKTQNAVIWIDEIEKAVAGKNDMTGIAQDQIGQLLEYMANNVSAGLIFLGHPGTGKSAIAKCAGTDSGVPTIRFDMGDMQGSLVGESQQAIRSAIKTVDAITEGAALWIVTCNDIAALPPELQSRFSLGTYFFDLPTSEERAGAWNIHRAAYGLNGDESYRDVNDAGWTGREIMYACNNAWITGKDIAYEARRVIPQCKASRARIETLQQFADGRFLDASTGTEYRRKMAQEQPSARRISVE